MNRQGVRVIRITDPRPASPASASEPVAPSTATRSDWQVQRDDIDDDLPELNNLRFWRSWIDENR